MDIDLDGINFTELNGFISQESNDLDSDLMDVILSEESSIAHKLSQEESDLTVVLYDMIRLKRENKILAKRFNMLESVLKTRSNELNCYLKTGFVNNTEYKDKLMKSRLEISQDNKCNSIFFLDGRKKKDNKKKAK
jgi:DNA repair exonuclease SbcCD ATPase subunit